MFFNLIKSNNIFKEKWNKEHHLYEDGDLLILKCNQKCYMLTIENFLYDKIKYNNKWYDINNLTIKNSSIKNYVNWSLLIRNSKKIENNIINNIIDDNEPNLYNSVYDYINDNMVYIEDKQKELKDVSDIVYEPKQLKCLSIRFKLFNNNFWTNGELINITNNRYLLIKFKQIIDDNSSIFLYYKDEPSKFPYHYKTGNYISEFDYLYYMDYIFYFDINDIEKFEIKKLNSIKKEYLNKIKENRIIINDEMLDFEASEYKKILKNQLV